MTDGPWGKSASPQPSPDKDPDLDRFMRGGDGRFKNFGGGAPQTGTSAILFAVVLGLAMWLGTGFYRVQPEENAVIMTFGKWTDTKTQPGLGYHLPWPAQSDEKVNVAFDRRIEIGAATRAAATTDVAMTSSDSMMLTGDENIIDINFVVLWRIADAGKYLFKIRDPEVTIRKVAESAMRETIGRTEIQKAMTGARGDIEAQTKELMQKILDEYESGVVINSVQLLRVDPPAPVVDAFDDVQRARTDLERLKNEAETYRNDIVPRARGEAQKMTQDAEAYKQAVTTRAQGDAARFNSVYEAYAGAKDVTARRMYMDAMEDVMKNSRKVIVDGDAKGSVPVLPYMNLDAQKAGEKK